MALATFVIAVPISPDSRPKSADERDRDHGQHDAVLGHRLSLFPP